MSSWILDLIKSQPEWATFFIALTAFGESFLFVGLFFPGTAILIAAGGLIAEGVLEPVSVVTAGIVGGILGDAASFWLGQKFGGVLPNLWPFRGNRERLERGIDFFERYGAISVFLGRFLGPLRATVPAVAGMMQMPTWRFYVANVLSAVLWVPALVLSGDFLLRVFGRNTDPKLLLAMAIALAVVIAILFDETPKAGTQSKMMPLRSGILSASGTKQTLGKGASLNYRHKNIL